MHTRAANPGSPVASRVADATLGDADARPLQGRQAGGSPVRTLTPASRDSQHPRRTRLALAALLGLSALGAPLAGCMQTSTNREHLEHKSVVLRPGDDARSEFFRLN